MKKSLFISSIILLVLIIPTIFALQNTKSCDLSNVSQCTNTCIKGSDCKFEACQKCINKNDKMTNTNNLTIPSCGIISCKCTNKTCSPSDETLVGNDRDEHGCIGSAGYSWCEEKQKCLRIWEENCSNSVDYSCQKISDCVSTCSKGCVNNEYVKTIKNDCNNIRAYDCSCVGNVCYTDGRAPSENKSLPGEGKVKILPETASQRARERLGELGFNISLKEVGKNNETKMVYEAKAIKEGKLFGFMKVKGEVSAEIDAETGEVTKVHKPWWSFMATGI